MIFLFFCVSSLLSPCHSRWFQVVPARSSKFQFVPADSSPFLVLVCTNKNRLGLKLQKCVFTADRVIYFGFKVTKYGVPPVKEKNQQHKKYNWTKKCFGIKIFLGTFEWQTLLHTSKTFQKLYNQFTYCQSFWKSKWYQNLSIMINAKKINAINFQHISIWLRSCFWHIMPDRIKHLIKEFWCSFWCPSLKQFWCLL